jgi:hypothetical protein
MRQHHMKQEASSVDIENRYQYLYDPEYSPEAYKRKQNLLNGNRGSIQLNKISERPV